MNNPIQMSVIENTIGTYNAVFIVIFVSTFLVILPWLLRGKPKIRRSQQESFYLDPNTGQKHPFPNLIQNKEDEQVAEPTIGLSVVVPAYNEQDRLPKMLDETLYYLDQRAKHDANFTYEIIVVDDGSTDKTSAVTLTYVEKHGCDKVRLLRCDRNGGKGTAVRLGILSSRGCRLLFADADGATKFSDIEQLNKFMDSVPNPEWAVAVGSRAHLQDKPKNKSHRESGDKQQDDDNDQNLNTPEAERSWFRWFLMHGFHIIVYIGAVRSIRDTQCGFKMFGRRAAVKLFNHLHVTGWAFDVELLSLCEYLKLPMKEIPVNWVEIDGSKIIPIFSWLAMGRDVLVIAFMQHFGIWSKPKMIF